MTQTVTLSLWLVFRNQSKFTRGQKKAQMVCELCDLRYYAEHVVKTGPRDYELRVVYENDADLFRKIAEMVDDIHRTADNRNCWAELTIQLTGTDRYWSDSEMRFL